MPSAKRTLAEHQDEAIATWNLHNDDALREAMRTLELVGLIKDGEGGSDDVALLTIQQSLESFVQTNEDATLGDLRYASEK